MGDITEAVTPSSAIVTTTTPSHSRALPIREDCWSEEATSTLVDAWGQRYLELNRGNLRQKDWQDVADSVNALHGHTKKTHRTDVQCKNRIDTIKKKYKVEKARVVSSNGTLTSSWPFYERLDALIGSSFPANKPTPSRNASPSLSPSPPVALPLVSYRGTPSTTALPQKRPASVGDGGSFKRNYSAMAAAAAAETDSEDEEEEEEEDEEEVDEEEEEERTGLERGGGGGVRDGGEGVRRLARAIERFGEVYEKMEREKLRQMVDLEKQRMKFAKDLEMERMRIFTETQIQLEKIKKGNGGGGGGGGGTSGKLQQQHHHQRPPPVSNGERDY